MAEEKSPALERHAQTIIGTIVIGLIIWVGNTVTSNQGAIIRFTERVSYLTETVAKLEKSIEKAGDDRYTAKDAIRDHQVIKDQIFSVHGRLRALESHGALQ